MKTGLLSIENLKYFPLAVKAYIRKGAALVAMKEFGKAQRAYEDALMLDANNAEARDGLRLCLTSNDESPETVSALVISTTDL